MWKVWQEDTTVCGEMVDVRITGALDYDLIGEIINA